MKDKNGKFLILALVMSIFTACSGNTEESTPAKKANEVTANDTENTKTSETSNEDESNNEESKADNPQVDNEEESESLSKEELFNKLSEEASLDSYKIDTTTQQIAKANSDNPEEINSTEGYVEFNRESNIYHSLYTISDPSVGQMEMESYQVDNLMVYRKDDSGWVKTPMTEDGEDVYNLSDTDKNSNRVFKELEEYYELSENSDDYTLELESNPENINEMKDIILGDTSGQVYVGELTSVKSWHKFRKDNLYPISYDFEIEFTDENGDVRLYNYTSEYKEINEIDEINVPDEVKALLEE